MGRRQGTPENPTQPGPAGTDHVKQHDRFPDSFSGEVFGAAGRTEGESSRRDAFEEPEGHRTGTGIRETLEEDRDPEGDPFASGWKTL